jgi:hypothetical protein
MNAAAMGFIGVVIATVTAVAAPEPPADHAPAAFRAGAATSNITPALGASLNGGMTDRKATHVHDELHARCLVLDDGTTKLAIAVCDSCMIPREVVDEAKRLIVRRTRIPPSHVLISATHAHSCPTATSVFQSRPDPGYQKFLAARIADGVQRAANNLEPATIGWGVGTCSTQVYNRRWRMKPGTIPPDPFGNSTDQVQMNPPVGSENLVEPAGPTDGDVWVLSLDRPQGSPRGITPIAVVANYALHYVGGFPYDQVSADYFGEVSRRLETGFATLDPPVVAMLSNGASGNINNIDFTRRRNPQPPYEQVRLVAKDVAGVVGHTLNGPRHEAAMLAAKTATLKLGVRKPTTDQIARAEKVVAEAGGRGLRTYPEVYAGETLDLAGYPDEVELVLQVVRIGDTVICAIPCEVFVEIGMELKQKSPFKPTVIFSLANGYNGYLPTPGHHKLGGYETWRAKSSYLEVDAAPKIVATLLELLDQLK